MKLLSFFLVLCALVGTALAWDKEDYEIFDIVSALEDAEGKGTTFYSFLGVPASASVKEIAKAYKTLSVTMHPDKNPNVKGIAERFARLGTIQKILRQTESRKRYDFFYKNGVPKWKGSGYFYSRWRPGFLTVSIFLVGLTAGFQHLFRYLNYQRDLKRITDLIADAQNLAWTTPSQARAGAPITRTPVTTKDAKKKVMVPMGGGGRTVECLVMREGEVYLVDTPTTQTLLAPSIVTAPLFNTTWPFAFARSLQSKIASSPIPTSAAAASDGEEGSDEVDSDSVVEDSTVEKKISRKVEKAEKKAEKERKLMEAKQAGLRRR